MAADADPDVVATDVVATDAVTPDAVTPDAVTPDAVDALIDQWRRVRPDLAAQLPAMATIGRLGRLNAMIRPAVEAVLQRHGLGVADFDVLATLRRSGEPFVLRPSDLARTLMLSPAGITGRLDRLEQAGHITRRLDPDDRRSLLVELTPGGLATVDAAVTDHLANEARLLAAITADERRTLDRILRKLTVDERDGSPDGRGG
jgi:DNA-binding MarR family transcriptional regulator